MAGAVETPLRAQRPPAAPPAAAPHAESRLAAQLADTTSAAPLLLVTGLQADRWRVAQLSGRAPAAGWLMRTPSTVGPVVIEGPGAQALRWWPVAPAADVVYNSALPFSLNDGSLWAGRGVSAFVTGGVEARLGRVKVRVIPEVTVEQNRGFFVVPSPDTARSSYASPWHSGTWSADLPLRFGNQSVTRFGFGQSMVGVSFASLQAGASTEGQWWGPGIRNALVMSDNAGGIPQLFLRSARPLRTGAGDVEFRVILGGLTESLQFDRDPQNDLRSLSGAVVSFQPSGARDLTLGLSRVVYAEAGNFGDVLTHAADVAARWSGLGDSTAAGHGVDGMWSLFGRWLLPVNGAEVWGEWARLRTPSSLRALLVAPQESQGWTVGLQWARPLQGGTFRVQTEATTLEQIPLQRAEVQSFYTSRAVPQGYTQRGQPIGAAIGPGASTQWLAVDQLAPTWSAGLFAGRIRWENDAYYTRPTSIAYFSHDVTTFIGLRGDVRTRGYAFGVELTHALRRNYLFQNIRDGFGADPTFDEGNTTIRVRVEPGRVRLGTR